MGNRKVGFENDKIYHVYNRGVEKRNIFQNNADYWRFIHDIYEFNQLTPANPNFSRKAKTDGGATSINKRKEEEKLVEILCFSLMPNHFHFILKQIVEGGIVRFMRKLGTGYAMYFNKKYERVGALFQNRFKSILIEDDNYLIHLSRYLHLNPVELIDPNWKENGISDWKKVKKFLKGYRWSSYLDYIGISNIPSIIERDFLLELFKSEKDYQDFVEDYIKYEFRKIADFVFES